MMAIAHYMAKYQKYSKYGNRKIAYRGITFDSKKEFKRYLILKQLERSGKVSSLKLQVKYPITINNNLVCTYIADFVYTETKTNKDIIEDCKSPVTRKNAVYRIKNKLMKAIYSIDIYET